MTLASHETTHHHGRAVAITATGAYVPERILTNAELTKTVDTTDEWIFTRTGIRERRIAAPEEASSDMAVKAAQKAMAESKLDPSDLEQILVATCTPDMLFPSTACYVQKMIGASRASCMDVSAACSGFLYAMETARQFISSGAMQNTLVIGAEKMSGVVDWNDRTTCVLFGDGAGAAVLQPAVSGRGLITTIMGSDGTLSDLLTIPGGGSRHPISETMLGEGLQYVKMAGREVFKYAVTHMAEAAQQALSQSGVNIEDVACIIPHQANARIIQAIGQRIGAPMEKIFMNVDRYGNTSAASIIIALDEAAKSGRIQRGDLVLLVVFGAGFTWAATLMEW
jgi:3-oxoacyl-[acyl-carrier-protein] synthase III